MANRNEITYPITKNSDDAICTVLEDILSDGTDVKAGKSLSTGSELLTKELVGYRFEITNPCDRLLVNPKVRFNLPLAIARFIWLIAGNDRLYDIEFYHKKVVDFSDDDIVVPGSSYGRRMRYARPGLDQLTACIDRLREDSTSRRAAISIFFPEDTERKSKDIPCSFGIFFHVRGDELIMTNIMRSNNCIALLPYNIFEFSLVGEIVAAALNIKFRKMIYFGGSMHLYERDFELAQSIVAEAPTLSSSKLMQPIAANENILKEVTKLVRKEAELRLAIAGITHGTLDAMCKSAKEFLSPFFAQFYLLLLLFAVKEKTKLVGAHDLIKAHIDNEYLEYIGSTYDRTVASEENKHFELVPMEEASDSDGLVDVRSPQFNRLFTSISNCSARMTPALSPDETKRLLVHFSKDLALASRLDQGPPSDEKIMQFIHNLRR